MKADQIGGSGMNITKLPSVAICMSAPSASRRAKVVPPKQVGQH